MKRHEQALELNKNEKPTPEQERIERKLKKHRIKYTSNKVTRIEPWGELDRSRTCDDIDDAILLSCFSANTKDAATHNDQCISS